MTNVKIIVASTRPGRKGPAVANWIFGTLKARQDINVSLLDLAVINLPFLDEPDHPMKQNYQKEHTKAWSKLVDEAEAFVIVTPEYNFGYPAPLKNALDFLFKEWNYKPVAFVSYGGVAGGTRSVQQLKQVVTAQKMMPLAEAVSIPFFTKYINEGGLFVADDALNKSAEGMITELLKWSVALKEMRQKK